MLYYLVNPHKALLGSVAVAVAVALALAVAVAVAVAAAVAVAVTVAVVAAAAAAVIVAAAVVVAGPMALEAPRGSQRLPEALRGFQRVLEVAKAPTGCDTVSQRINVWFDRQIPIVPWMLVLSLFIARPCRHREAMLVIML